MFATALVDTNALWHVALEAFAATMLITGAYGVAVLAVDRMQGGGRRGAWPAALALSGLVTLAVLVLGLWAMLQKS